MLRIIERLTPGSCTPTATLTLPYELRTRGRQRVVLDDGREAGLFLDRGPILRGGDLLRAEDGTVVRVVAAGEEVSMVRTDDAHQLARVCYHLGNRHTPVQILADGVRYQHDHVLDAMLRGLGVEVQAATLPFEPEPGAYGEHGSGHAHGHSHAHGRIHAH